MEGESASSSQQVTSNAPPTGALPSPSITPSSGEVSTTNAGSIQQNSQQNQSGNNTIVGGGQSNVSSGPMHQNIMSNQPNFQQSQQRPGIAVNRGRQHTPYSHFSSMSGAGTPPSAMHPQRGGVQMPGIGMSAQQRPQALGGPYVHNLQQQQMGGIPRASMIGQHQGAGHPSMLSSGQAEQLSSMQSPYTTHQTRQKPVSIQSSPYQHPVSSGQPLQGMQTIGMMGSLGLGSQIRPSGVFSHTQQRPVQGSMRSQSPSQKMHAQNLPRVPSLGTMGSQLSGMSQGGQSTVVSSSLPHQQQWLPSQAKQMHQSNLSSLASPSYQPHPKQQSLQQRPQHGQPLQQSLPSTPQQQQQPPHQPQEQHSQQYQQQRMQQPLQAVPQQQQMLRTPGIPIQKPIITTGTQPATPASGTSTSAGSNDQASETSNQILGKRSLQELVAQIDPNEKLYPEVEDVLIEIADDFVESAKLRILSTVKTIVEERRKVADDKQLGDFLDILLANNNLLDQEKLSLVLDLLLGGYETTSLLMAMIIKFLGDSQHAFAQLKTEHQIIRRTKQKDEHLSWDDYKRMTFTQNVINEALRCGNIVKFVHRKALKDVKFKEFEIPAGWKVLPVFTGVHLDQSLNKDATDFNPWRWQMPITTKQFTPFGGGPRLCPGSELAKVETAFFIHHLVLNFRWRIDEPDYSVAHPYVEFEKGLPLVVERM